jgi:hypothetical protein
MFTRQAYALGAPGQQRLSNAAALVVGMRGVGAEAGARGGAARARGRLSTHARS